MPAIQNVTLAGGTGNVGSVALSNLLASRFTVQVLRRHGSKSTFPEGTRVIDVDFDSVEAIAAALKGQDAVVNTLPPHVASIHTNIIDAAVAAGVQRLIPSDFGSNMHNANSRVLPVFADKVRAQDHLMAKAATGAISYTFVYNGPFLDWGLDRQFILPTAGFKPSFLNDGTAVFSTTNLGTVGRAIVAILEKPEETKDRVVYLEDIKTSQARLLELAMKAAPEKPWQKPTQRNVDELVKKAGEELAKGNFAPENVVPFIYKSFTDPGYGISFDKTDNELLGLGTTTEDFIVEEFRRILN